MTKHFAEEVGSDAVAQEKAREQIETSANELAKTDDKASRDNARPKKLTPQEMKAANNLSQAMNDFARTQRRIGENAREISNEQDVANKPLVKALEAASKLPKPNDAEGKMDEKEAGEEPKTSRRAGGQSGAGPR